MIDYLQQVLGEYTDWSREGRTTRPGESSLLSLLTRDYDRHYASGLPPGDPAWDPGAHMPFEYDDGLEQSKLILRAYAYDNSEEELAELRAEIEQRIAKRRELRGKAAGPAESASEREGPTRTG
jgi:hypothetical protein